MRSLFLAWFQEMHQADAQLQWLHSQLWRDMDKILGVVIKDCFVIYSWFGWQIASLLSTRCSSSAFELLLFFFMSARHPCLAHNQKEMLINLPNWGRIWYAPFFTLSCRNNSKNCPNSRKERERGRGRERKCITTRSLLLFIQPKIG